MQGEIKYMSDIFGFDDVLEGAENDTGNEFTGGVPVTNDELSGEPAGDNEKSPPHGEQTNGDEIIADFFGDEENAASSDYERAGEIPVSDSDESDNDAQGAFDTQNPVLEAAAEMQEASSEAVHADEKYSAQQALSSGKSALKLNRQLIFYFTVMGILLLAAILIFFTSFRKKPEEKKTIAKASERYVPDFPLSQGNEKEGEKNTALSETLAKEDPPDNTSPYYYEEPVASSEQNTYTYQGAAGGGASRSKRPDTRNNAIQKPIQGIKGLTPTGRTAQSAAQGSYQSGADSAIAASQTNPYAQFGLPAKEDLMKQILSQQGLRGGFINSYDSQNNQSGKENFYTSGKGTSDAGQFLSAFSIFQGTIIPAVLITGINTDLPGDIIARVTSNVYSSQTGQFLLIPQGTLLFASYNSSVSYAQNRVQIAWHTLIRPDGFMMELGNMQGADAQGYAGVRGKVDHHVWAFLGGMLLTTAVGLGETARKVEHKVEQLPKNSYLNSATNSAYDATKRLADKIIDRALDIQPTIVIAPGESVNVLTNANLALPPVAPPAVTRRYIRH